MPKHGGADLDEFTARMDELHAEAAARGVLVETASTFSAHTDGACLGNPDGPGGWAAIMRHNGEPLIDLWGHLSSTSNNRAEVLGVLSALEWVPRESTIKIFSDSQYTLSVLTGHFKAKANVDIWSQVRTTIDAKKLIVDTEWVRGHAGDAGNEMADYYAGLGAVKGNLDRLEAMRAQAAQKPGRPSSSSSSKAPVKMPPELEGLVPNGSWEKEFLGSLARQIKGGKALSPKQEAVLTRIRERGSA